MIYLYTEPKEHGYVKFKMNNDQHKLLYSQYRLNSIFRSNHYWINNNSIYVENQLPTILLKVILTVGFPFIFIYYMLMIGLKGVPELLKAYKEDLYFTRRYGSFSSDTTWKQRAKYVDGETVFTPTETYAKVYNWLEKEQPEVIAKLKKGGIL